MVGGERPTLFSDAWSLGAVVLQWMTRLPPWDMQVGGAQLDNSYALQGSTNRRPPGCVNAAGKLRQMW